MARETASQKRSTESRLIFTILGVTVWVATGFLVGLVAGVVSEEPELLVDHLAGEGTEIEWSGDAIDVAAAPHPTPRIGPAVPTASVFEPVQSR